MLKILLVLLLSLSHGVFANETLIDIMKPGRYQVFNYMSVEDAKNRADKMAKEDYESGNYRYLVYGLRMDEKSFGGYLEERYGIKDTRAAGCIVTGSVEEATDSYNSTMKQLLTEKYGRDIYKEAEEMGTRSKQDNI